MTILYIVLGVVGFLLILFVISVFNNLVRARNKTKEAFSSIDVHLKLRYDLIPNLVNVVEGYRKHETEIFSRVADIRAKATAAETEKQKAVCAGEAGQLIKHLFATQEDYPELKSNKLFRRLQRELIEIEDKISAARRFYNSEVNRYNNLIMQFPTNVVAKLFGFKKKDTFELESIKEAAVEKVEL